MKNFSITVALGAAAFARRRVAQRRRRRCAAPGAARQTRAEAQQRADMMFQLFDMNHDGTVTRAEADRDGAICRRRAATMARCGRMNG